MCIFLGHDRQLAFHLFILSCLLSFELMVIIFWLQVVAGEEGFHRVEVVTSEVKALEAVVHTMEAEGMEGASSVIDLIMEAEVVAGVAHHVEVMSATSGLTQPVVVVPGHHRLPLLSQSE
jgi:hypothetical protein